MWHYVLRVKGVCHDDFKYELINKILNKKVASSLSSSLNCSTQLKVFIKKVACTPDAILRVDYVHIDLQFKPYERVHINLLALESRRSVCVVCGCRVEWGGGKWKRYSARVLKASSLFSLRQAELLHALNALSSFMNSN